MIIFADDIESMEFATFAAFRLYDRPFFCFDCVRSSIFFAKHFIAFTLLLFYGGGS